MKLDEFVRRIRLLKRKSKSYDYNQNSVIRDFSLNGQRTVKNNLGYNAQRSSNTPVIIDGKELWFTGNGNHFIEIKNTRFLNLTDMIIRLDVDNIEYIDLYFKRCILNGRTEEMILVNKQKRLYNPYSRYPNYCAVDLDLLDKEIERAMKQGMIDFEHRKVSTKKREMLVNLAKNITNLELGARGRSLCPSSLGYLQFEDFKLKWLSGENPNTVHLNKLFDVSYDYDGITELVADYSNLLKDYKIKVEELLNKHLTRINNESSKS